ncbi:related to 50S ribosomal protein L22 [Sporisorium reilianum SRZ2]|uniref:Related to 50S ribosomal protein L22 n=2 Tax=Sporisorium reilianum TaxID=72558 RepID=E6ZQY5_SPORE|nr:related to 50S ribosomal protein L22 [Sporisorium reilianum SRZ2]SJX65288.1 related to 50S ribosomal protein L22 [Sporisorium reilianum f. sp. reilianum]
MSASNTAGRTARHLLRSSLSNRTKPSTSALVSPNISQRSVSSSAPRPSFLSSISDRLAKVALGDNYTKSRQRGGVLPADQAKLDYERRRDSAMASVSPDGMPLFDDVESLPISQQAQRAQQRISAKIATRQLRKRFNAKHPVTGEALEHKYSTAAFKISPRKLQLLANQISGQPIDYAILQMQFSPKRAAKRVLSTLALARDHAAAKGMQVPRLVVSEAWVGKGVYLTRADIKGRARMGRKQHPQARLSVVLRYGKTYAEKEVDTIALARKRVRAIGTGGVVRTDNVIVNGFQRPGWGW